MRKNCLRETFISITTSPFLVIERGKPLARQYSRRDFSTRYELACIAEPQSRESQKLGYHRRMPQPWDIDLRTVWRFRKVGGRELDLTLFTLLDAIEENGKL